ncbi:MAG: OmpA family protein [Rhizomicrobium sp.]|jgi:outer membrane protein OmpA-like peptidoglycan-associated protein
MRSIRTLLLAGAFALPAAPVLAQMYPGQDITVNPWAVGAAPVHLGIAPIHLHMPVHRVHRHAVVHAQRSAEASKPVPAANPQPMIGTMADRVAPPKPAKKPAPVKAAAAAPAPPAAQANNDIGTTGMDDAIPFSLDGVHNAAPPKSAPQKPAAKPTQTASVQPAQTAPASQPGMTKRGEILFTKSATDPAPAQFDGLKLLAGDLSDALKNGSSRIQLEAYGGAHGDKGSDARRLSLKRALSIRQVLIDNGVPASSIDVRAMGGADDSGPTDRVDVYVRAG